MRNSFLAVVLFACSVVHAENVTRDYPIEPMIFGIQDFGNREHGEARSAADQRLDLMRQQSAGMKRLATAAEMVVSQEPGAKVTALPNAVRVTASEENQKRVAGLIQNVRRDRLTPISLEIRLFLVNKEVSKSLPAELREDVAKVRGIAGGWSAVSSMKAKELIERFSAPRDSSSITGPRLTLFNGQKANIVLMTEVAFVADIHVIKAADGAVAYEPELRTINPGVEVTARATLNHDQSAESIVVQTKWTRLLSLKSERWTQAPAGQNLHIQVPELDELSADCVVNLTPGESALLMLERPKGREREDGFEPYLLITPTVLPLPEGQ